jgi:hypothetical protein
VSLAALWALARIRFPERPVTPNPVPPLLTQLTEPRGFEDLAAQIAQLEPRIMPSLALAGSSVALRVRDHAGLVLGPPPEGAVPAGDRALAVDPISGLRLVPVAPAPAPEVRPWDGAQLDRSRYLLAADVAGGSVALRPVFVSRLDPVQSAAWPNDIWLLPRRTNVAPGEFLFTLDGAFAGLAAAHAGVPALVPGSTVLGAVDTLVKSKGVGGGWLGVEVQTVPPSLSAGSEGPSGVIVTWVHPRGPAAQQLLVMDVIEAIGDAPIASPAEWRSRVAQVPPGATIALRTRRGVTPRDVSLTAAGGPPPAEPASLGLTMRTLRRVGVEVLAVDGGSAAARAGIREGDVITAIGDVHAPTAQEVIGAFDAAPAGGVVLAAVTRGNAHRIVEVIKK